MKFHINKSVKDINPRGSLGYLVIRNIVVQGTPPSLAQEFFHLQVEAAKFYNIEECLDIPPLIGVRGIYKKVEFKPERHTKASEELVRRIMQRKGVYVNSTVAINNYCAIKFLLPFGLYDLDKIDGDVICQLGAEETEIKHNSSDMPNNNAVPLLMDDIGVFGNPYLDAVRTKVTLATRNILVVVYADAEVNRADLTNILSFTKEMILSHNGGNIEVEDILSV